MGHIDPKIVALPRILAFPKSGIAYNDCLYAAAEKSGLNVQEGIWAGRWLLSHVQSGDVVHIHWPSFHYYDPASRLKTLRGIARFLFLYALIRLRGARVVWTAHNLYPHEGGRNPWSHRLVRRFIARRAALIIVHSRTARAVLKSEFGVADEKIAEVPHGNWIGYHPHTIEKDDARRMLGIPGDAYVYAIVGACRPYKGLEALIDAFRRLDGNGFLLIAGHFASKEYRARIERLLAELPASRFRLEAEFIPNEKVQNYVVASDVLVLPYTEILTSGSAMLGLSFGVPVVVPDLGSMRDLVTEQCGLLYDAKAAEGLLRSLEQVRFRQYSAAAITDYARAFDWSKSVEAFTAAIARLR